MSRAERQAERGSRLSWHREHELPVGTVLPSVLAAAAGLVAMWPFTSVIEPGSWSFAVLAVIVVTALTGMTCRTLMRGRPAWARDLVTIAVQILVVMGTVILLVAGDTAVFGVVPTEATFYTFQALAAAAWEEIAFGSAPLAASPGLQAVMGLGFGVVAILLDQLVAQRGAILASLLTAVVGSMPMIATLGGVNVVWFVLLGILILVLLRYTAAQNPDSPRRTSVAVAAGVGVAALAATVIVAPVLPVSATLTGTGTGVTVDASLRLGDDLRQPNPVEVLTLATTADTAPYLRLTTLSSFDGRVWEPDRGDLQAQSEGFGPDEWADDIETTDQNTSIRVIRMSSSWLPVPYPATGVQGLSAAWRVSPENRTLASRNGDAVGNDYTVRSLDVSPTLEQIRALPAASPIVDPDAEPVDLPDVIGETAAEVTADATNDYDRLVALQSWFRSQFAYSLETPVDEGFDGTGADAVAEFLEVRSGYCIHFAGAFALMAESLDMEVRIVVGYLPGALTETTRGDEAVYSVSSDQLHSWPEVLFPGVGWVPFEPTASLGVPTAFSAAATTGGGTGGAATPAPTAAPSTEQTSGPELEREDAGDNAGATGERRQLDPTPVVLTTLGVLVVLLIPAFARLAVRFARRGRARDGDAGAAWAELRATMQDLRVPLSDAETPRMRGDDLVRDSGVNADAVRVLVAAVEQASYARPSASAARDLDAALIDVTAQLRRSVDRWTRVHAFLLPRSLFVSRRTDVPLLV
ncbi:transglutaminaseTgpA domain-containing protein [Microbacterium sp. NPDC090014]|uniref:transglutaminase family protein n=1 Tax=Microbacterium sp. NPDC090014 TaxID=3364205 RepID=UPI0038262ED2